MTPKRKSGWLRRLAPVLMAFAAGSLAWMLISATSVQLQHAGAATPTPEADGPSVTNRGGDESDVRPTPTPSPTPRPIVVSTPTPTPTPTPRKRTVVLDPGHGGAEVGAADNGVVEKISNLEMAFRVEALLRAKGIEVVLTRRFDERAVSSGPGWTAQHFDLQGRIDIANAAKADAFVSIHSNSFPGGGLNGVEVWADPSAARGLENNRLALQLKERVLAELHAWGYAATDRGLYDASCWAVRAGNCYNLFVISAPRAMTYQSVLLEDDDADPAAIGLLPGTTLLSRPVTMPAALIELLFISNESDAAVLTSEGGRRAMAKGIADAIVSFLDSSAAAG